MEYILLFVAGVLFGAGLVLLLARIQRKDSRGTSEQLKESFSAVSLEVISKSIEELQRLNTETLSKERLAGEKDLDAKKGLIDHTLGDMKREMDRVKELISAFEKDRQHKFGELTGQLRTTAETLQKLQETTGGLEAALSSSQTRGQWGERMAEDVLRIAGFVEGINYLKQKTLATAASRPDFTFLLPQDYKLNMDVKFPWDNYRKYLETDSEAEKEQYRDQFLKDVRLRIAEVTTRDYINPEEHTVSYVLVFVPNEQIFSFIFQADPGILDEALQKQVVLCSPFTLFAVLAVVNQAVENFHVGQRAEQIMQHMAAFKKQWEMYANSFGKLGRRIEDVEKEYNLLVSTRRNQLERRLEKIEELKLRTVETPALDMPAAPEDASTEA